MDKTLKHARHSRLIFKIYKRAIQWDITDKNQCVGIAKFQENNVQQKFLNKEDIKRLLAAMAVDSNQSPNGYHHTTVV